MRNLKVVTTKGHSDLPELPAYLNFNKVANIIISRKLFCFQARNNTYFGQQRSLNTAFSKAKDNGYMSEKLAEAVTRALEYAKSEEYNPAKHKHIFKVPNLLNITSSDSSLKFTLSPKKIANQQKRNEKKTKNAFSYVIQLNESGNNHVLKHEIFDSYQTASNIEVYCLNSALENKDLNPSDLELIQFKNLTLRIIFDMILNWVSGATVKKKLTYHLTNYPEANLIWERLPLLITDYINAQEILGLASTWQKLIQHTNSKYYLKTEIIKRILCELNKNKNLKVFYHTRQFELYPTLLFDAGLNNGRIFHITSMRKDKSFVFKRGLEMTLENWTDVFEVMLHKKQVQEIFPDNKIAQNQPQSKPVESKIESSIESRLLNNPATKKESVY